MMDVVSPRNVTKIMAKTCKLFKARITSKLTAKRAVLTYFTPQALPARPTLPNESNLVAVNFTERVYPTVKTAWSSDA